MAYPNRGIRDRRFSKRQNYLLARSVNGLMEPLERRVLMSNTIIVHGIGDDTGTINPTQEGTSSIYDAVTSRRDSLHPHSHWARHDTIHRPVSPAQSHLRTVNWPSLNPIPLLGAMWRSDQTS